MFINSSNTANSCSIFDERYLWYKHTKKVEQKWGTPIYIQLAIIKMESDFDWLAKPARQKIFKVIPLKDHQVHLVIHKQLKEPGNNIKKKQEIN